MCVFDDDEHYDVIETIELSENLVHKTLLMSEAVRILELKTI